MSDVFVDQRVVWQSFVREEKHTTLNIKLTLLTITNYTCNSSSLRVILCID